MNVGVATISPLTTLHSPLSRRDWWRRRELNPLPKPSASQLPRASPLYFISTPPSVGATCAVVQLDWFSSACYEQKLTGDSDLVTPGTVPTDSGQADAQSIKPRKRSCYSQLLVLPLFTRPTAPRLATESRTGSVEPFRPHLSSTV